jgi:peptidoglycan/LPS O-acetylase OafA/YrhL
MGNGMTRYQALDGLRTVAILLVLLSHVNGAPGVPACPPWWWHLGDLGNLGVRFFFVLSGFVITHGLIREGERQGRIDLRAFHVRRAFRILPPFAVLMAAVGLGMALGLWQVPVRQFLLSLFFLGNYPWAGGSWILGHLWALAVEAQFYLLWPAVMALTVRRTGARMPFIFAGLVLAPLMRALGPAHGMDYPGGFIENSDSLAMGALAAILFADKTPGRLRRMMEATPAMLSGLMIFMLNVEPIPLLVRAAVCYPLTHLFLAVLILRLVRAGTDPVARILSSAPFVFGGAISYSFYLFQQPIFMRPPLAWMPVSPWSLLLAFALASAGYFCVERPAVKWKDRFARRQAHDG